MRILFLSCICCAIPLWATAGERVQSLIQLREQHVVVQKWDTSCGAAALATVLNFEHGDRVSERDITAAMLKETGIPKVKYRGGFSLLDLKRYATGRGYAADGYADMAVADLP